MRIEDLETIWAGQQPTSSRAVDIRACWQSLRPELRRRSRFLGYEAFAVIFGLLVFPLLSIVNFLHASPHDPVLYWLSLILHIVTLLALLLYVVRRIQRHRTLIRQSAGSIRTIAELSLTNLEAEMQDYRTARWLLPLGIGLALLSVRVNLPTVEHGWTPMIGRAGLIVGFFTLVGVVFWRHYRVNLMPANDRQKEILRQLS